MTMMKMTKYILIVMIGVTLFTSCEQEQLLFEESMSAVGFYGSTASVSEYNATTDSGGEVVIQFMVTTVSSSPACDITFEVNTTDISNPAVEGVDFEVISDKTASIGAGGGTYDLKITAINNDDFDSNGDKSFKLKVVSNSLDYNLSSESEMTITIVDDDHPLGWMVGSYAVATTETANGSSSHSGSITTVEGEINKIQIYGMAGAAYGPGLIDPYYILGTVSDDFQTVTIAAGQAWESWGYGSTELQVWEDDNGEGEETDTLTGTITQTDGGVVITFSQQFTFYITDGGNAGLGLQWSWNSDSETNSPTSVWTKQ
jgi:hypothetical protein